MRNREKLKMEKRCNKEDKKGKEQRRVSETRKKTNWGEGEKRGNGKM